MGYFNDRGNGGFDVSQPIVPRWQQQFEKPEQKTSISGTTGSMSPEMIRLADQLGISQDRATQIVGMKAPERPTGATGIARQIGGLDADEGGFDQDRIAMESKFTSFKNQISKGPEAILRNMSLVGTHPDIDLNDAYQFDKFSTPGFAEGIQQAHLPNFLEPNKENMVTKGGKAFLPAAVGVLATAMGGPLLGGAIGGALSTAMNQGIQGGLESIDLKDVAMGGATGLATGALGGVTQGISNPMLRAGAEGVGGAVIEAGASGDFDLGNMAKSAAVGTGMGIAGNALQGGYDTYQAGGDFGDVLSGAGAGAFGTTPSEFVSPNQMDFNDMDAENFGTLDANFNLAGTEGYNPSEDVFYDEEDISTQSDFEGINNEISRGREASIQSDFEGINQEIDSGMIDPSSGALGTPPSGMGAGLPEGLTDAAINSFLSSIMPGEESVQTSGGGITDGLMASLLGIGTGKKDKLSDLQVRGLGI